MKQKHYKIPGIRNLENISKRMSLTERLIFFTLLITAGLGASLLLWSIQSSLLVTIPAYDGTLREGIVGTPGPINPLLASTASDRAMVSLIYSGLTKANSEGELVHELSESYSVSEEKTEYIFKLRDNITFHDGVSVTAADVVFTIKKVKDPVIRSTLAGNWNNIHVEALDEKSIKFTLPEPRPGFLEMTTLGILPKHLWNEVDSNRFAFSSLNTHPVGTGPYKISSVSLEDGTPTQYKLRSFKDYVNGEPYIANLVFPFYHEEREAWNALQQGEIDALAGFSPQRMEKMTRSDIDIKKTPLPRVFAIFLNRNKNEALSDINVRKALSMAIDREEILSETINGKGAVISGPIPISITTKTIEVVAEDQKDEEEVEIETPESLLNKAGWKYDEELGGFTKDEETILTIEISTVSNSDLQKAAEVVQRNWNSLGVKTTLALYGSNELNQGVLRPREFEGLLFGYILDRDLDLFPFWHSSERNDPGMNLSLYTNISVDGMLEEYRQEKDPKEKAEIMQRIKKAISQDVPAIFLYSPHFLYATPDRIQDLNIGHLISPEERFLEIHKWFIETDRVWSFFL